MIYPSMVLEGFGKGKSDLKMDWDEKIGW